MLKDFWQSAQRKRLYLPVDSFIQDKLLLCNSLPREQLQSSHRLVSSLYSHPPKVIVLLGPTAIGKTDIAQALASRLPLRIISCDSVQVYKNLDIGSNKNKLVKQALLDLVSFEEPFNAALWREKCLLEINEAHHQGQIPLLTVGSEFYFRLLQTGCKTAPPIEKQLETELTVKMKVKGWEMAFNYLNSIDPDYAKQVSSNDWRRLVRALGVYETYQLPISSFSKLAPPHFDWRHFFLCAPKVMLFRYLDYRCECMILQGLVEEVIVLQKQGLTMNHLAARTIGYRETFIFLNALKQQFNQGKEASHDENKLLFQNYVTRMQIATRQLVHSQQRCFSAYPETHWIQHDRFVDLENKLDETKTALPLQCMAESILLERTEFLSHSALNLFTKKAKEAVCQDALETKLRREYLSKPFILNNATIQNQLLERYFDLLKE